ncbi:MAG TPA: hypothetical protein VFO41_11075 [Alphaproteobacteria bacterium]|nr:hypothetical protein [Alphaproteobacteria bacterium]
MQVSPSASLFQALSNLFQPQGAGTRGVEAQSRVATAEARPAQAAPRIDPSATTVRFDEPTPGTPIRRGMLVNILA